MLQLAPSQCLRFQLTRKYVAKVGSCSQAEPERLGWARRGHGAVACAARTSPQTALKCEPFSRNK